MVFGVALGALFGEALFDAGHVVVDMGEVLALSTVLLDTISISWKLAMTESICPLGRAAGADRS